MKLKVIILCFCFLHSLSVVSQKKSTIIQEKIPDEVRAKQISDMEFGMFICWSFSTFSGIEWTGQELPPEFFRATKCDTDQWARVAKEAGMKYIYVLTKHHDGFCLWDTNTTDLKVTNAPLKKDVLKMLRKSCDKYGIKLGLYYSEADWNWPGAKRGKGKNAFGLTVLKIFSGNGQSVIGRITPTFISSSRSDLTAVSTTLEVIPYDDMIIWSLLLV